MIKQGKKPISAKTSSTITSESPFGDLLKVDDDLKRELEAQNLEYRFVDAKQLYEFNGYHKNGWLPYKRKSADTLGFKYGSDPDGVVRRGTLILATRTKDLSERHRLVLAQKAQRLNAVMKTQADSLRQMAKERKADVTVSEGYEEN